MKRIILSVFALLLLSCSSSIPQQNNTIATPFFQPFALPKTKEGKLFIISAPSGTGKTTIADILLQRLTNFQRAITTTTRHPRPKEINGIDYHFVTLDQFDQMKGESAFLETAEQYDKKYGTAKKDVSLLLGQGKHVLLVIGTQGAKAIKTMMPDAVLIFLKPPSMEELERRLTGRNTEDAEAIAKRLLKAQEELQDEPCFQYSVINDDVQRTADIVTSIVIAECYRNTSV